MNILQNKPADLIFKKRNKMKKIKWKDKCVICKEKRSFQEKLVGCSICYECIKINNIAPSDRLKNIKKDITKQILKKRYIHSRKMIDKEIIINEIFKILDNNFKIKAKK